MTYFTYIYVKLTSHYIDVIQSVSMSIMQLITFMHVKGVSILIGLLLLCDSAVTSQRNPTIMKALHGKRFDVAPRDVITRSSAIKCAVACRNMPGCVSTNLFSGNGTCQLLSEEASNETSLETVNGWRYLRESGRRKTN